MSDAVANLGSYTITKNISWTMPVTGSADNYYVYPTARGDDGEGDRCAGNPWCEWVENRVKTTENGLIKYNDLDLFAGLLQIIEDVVLHAGRTIKGSELM